jgi:hypothetical protein
MKIPPVGEEFFHANGRPDRHGAASTRYFGMLHLLCINQIHRTSTTNKMHFSVYGVFYSQNSHQHVSAGIIAIFRVILLLQEYKCTTLVSCFAVNL